MPAETGVTADRKTVKPQLPTIQAARRRTMARLPLHVEAIQEQADGTYLVQCEIYGHRTLIPNLAFEELCTAGSESDDAEDDDPREMDDEPEQDDHGGEEYGI